MRLHDPSKAIRNLLFSLIWRQVRVLCTSALDIVIRLLDTLKSFGNLSGFLWRKVHRVFCCLCLDLLEWFFNLSEAFSYLLLSLLRSNVSILSIDALYVIMWSLNLIQAISHLDLGFLDKEVFLSFWKIKLLLKWFGFIQYPYCFYWSCSFITDRSLRLCSWFMILIILLDQVMMFFNLD